MPPRVVVLHGWSNTVEPLDFVMMGFKKLTGDLFFPQGPLRVSEESFIAFCKKHGTPDEVIAVVSKLPHFSWWEARPVETNADDPPGTKRYEGFEEYTLPYLTSYFSQNGPFDAIVGFSQGALLAVLLTTLAQAQPDAFSMFKTKGLCLVGSPHAVLSSQHHSILQNTKLSVPSLMLHGTMDKVCPLDEAKQILSHYVEEGHHGLVTLRLYPGAHHAPRDAETLTAFTSWVNGL